MSRALFDSEFFVGRSAVRCEEMGVGKDIKVRGWLGRCRASQSELDIETGSAGWLR